MKAATDNFGPMKTWLIAKVDAYMKNKKISEPLTP